MSSSSSYLCVGTVGFSIVTVVNLFAWLVSGQKSAVYFSDGWWSNWFPGYAVFGIFLFTALLRFRTDRAGS